MKHLEFHNAFCKLFTKFKAYNSCSRVASLSSYLASQNVFLDFCCQQSIISKQLCKPTFIKSNFLGPLFYIKGNFLSSSSVVNFRRSDVCKKKSTFENPYEELLQKKIRKDNFSPQILLLDVNNETSVMTLKRANELALQRELKLVKVDDPKRQSTGGKPVYQLLTGKQLLEERISAREKKKQMKDDSQIKGEKTLTFSSKIASADLEVKVKKLLSFLENKFIVNVELNLSKSEESKETMEEMLSQIEKSIVGIGILAQKQNSKRGITFIVKPITETGAVVKKKEEK